MLVRNQSVKIRDSALMASLKFNAVELSIECYGLKKMDLFSYSDPFAVVFVQGMIAGQWEEIDRTETIFETHTPRFVKKIRVPACTDADRAQPMRICVYDRDSPSDNLNEHDKIGGTEFSVSQLLDAQHMALERELCIAQRTARSRGVVMIALDMICHVESDERISISFGFLSGAPVRNRIFFVISRALQKGMWSPVYRSEVRLKDDLKRFEPAVLSSQEMHGGNASKLFRLEVFRYYKNGKTKLLGFVQTSLEKLKSLKPNSQLYWWPAQEGIHKAKVVIERVELTHTESTFSFNLAEQ